MVGEISQTAGRIWHVLQENGETTLSQLKKKVDGSTDTINQSIGWLAREDKLNIEKKGNSLKLVLK